MHGFKLIMFPILLFFNLSFASSFSLLKGTYVDQISQDSIYLEKTGDKYKLESTNGNIILFHVDDHIYDNGRIIINKLQPIGRVAGNGYVRSNNVFDIVRKIKPDD